MNSNTETIKKLEKKLDKYINLSYLDKFSDDVKLGFLTLFNKKNELHLSRTKHLVEKGYVNVNTINELKTVDLEIEKYRKLHNIDYKLIYFTNIIKNN